MLTTVTWAPRNASYVFNTPHPYGGNYYSYTSSYYVLPGAVGYAIAFSPSCYKFYWDWFYIYSTTGVTLYGPLYSYNFPATTYVATTNGFYWTFGTQYS